MKHDDRTYFVAIGPPEFRGLPEFQEDAHTQLEAEAMLLRIGGHVEQRCFQGCCSRVVAHVPSLLDRIHLSKEQTI